jgi:hypothetical protein
VALLENPDGYDDALKVDSTVLRCTPETRIKPYQKGKITTDKTQNPPSITEKDLINHARQLLTLRWERDHPIHRQVAEKYSLRSRLKKEEQKDVVAHMEQWIDSVLDLVLVFRNLETNEIVALPYTTRYTDYSRASALIRESGKAFQKAKEQFNEGIFLTITLPPIFPFKLALWILSFLHHRIKAYIKKKCGENRPHFKAIEPQESYSPHTHSVIFGVDWLMNKQELTQYLEKHLVNFLENLGDHYKKTINKRASELDVQALNLYGKKLLSSIGYSSSFLTLSMLWSISLTTSEYEPTFVSILSSSRILKSSSDREITTSLFWASPFSFCSLNLSASLSINSLTTALWLIPLSCAIASSQNLVSSSRDMDVMCQCLPVGFLPISILLLLLPI